MSRALLIQGEGGRPVSGGLQLSGSGRLSDLRGLLEHQRLEQFPASVLARSPLCSNQRPESSASEVQRSAGPSLLVCKFWQLHENLKHLILCFFHYDTIKAEADIFRQKVSVKTDQFDHFMLLRNCTLVTVEDIT